MNKLKFWDWDKKPRTMLRFIKSGDIFCFKTENNKYMFGRIISRLDIGDVAEIFGYTSIIPMIKEDSLKHVSRAFPPVVLNSYSLFDRKREIESDWRIIGHQNDYRPSDVENIYFAYGIENNCKKVDVFGNEQPISELEASKLPALSPHSDYHIKQLLKNI